MESLDLDCVDSDQIAWKEIHLLLVVAQELYDHFHHQYDLYELLDSRTDYTDDNLSLLDVHHDHRRSLFHPDLRMKEVLPHRIRRTALHKDLLPSDT